MSALTASRAVSREALGVALAALVFIAFSVWWLLYDQRIPAGNIDAARQLTTALVAADHYKNLELGNLLELGPYGSLFYPPLVHWIGGIPPIFGLAPQDWSTIAINLVFVPMLAFGCYGVGKLTYGRTAGLLAAVFALGTPMVLSLFHVFLIDAPLAAVVAAATWALLASERFTRRRETVLAGALIGIGLLVKTPAPVFLVGPVLVMLIGGGWRQWRNLALALVAMLLIAGPYYAIHLDEVFSLSEQTTSSGQLQGADIPYDPSASYERLSFDNALYYFWAALNTQYYLPLFALFAIGFVTAVAQVRRRRHLPELLAGLVLGYLTWSFLLSIRDPRYTLPLIVFVAVIATGWIAQLRSHGWRAAVCAALAATVMLNFVASATSSAPTRRIPQPDGQVAGTVDPWSAVLVSEGGWLVGNPRPDPFWDRLLAAARDAGFDNVELRTHDIVLWGSDAAGLAVIADAYGIREAQTDHRTDPADLVIDTWWRRRGVVDAIRRLGRPCGSVGEGTNAFGNAPIQVYVWVRRRLPDGQLVPWCELPAESQ